MRAVCAFLYSIQIECILLEKLYKYFIYKMYVESLFEM